jgi:hypothetical protein
MNDPHVQTLRFRLRSDHGVSYKDDAPPISYETLTFKATLHQGLLSMSMKPHFATPGEAIHAVIPDLRSWEITTSLRFGPGAFRFEFDGAEVIERTPFLPGSRHVHSGSGSGGAVAGGFAGIHMIMSEYPAPPTHFKADPNVEVLWDRYTRFRRGGEPLTGMGYFCLSVIQADAGGRQKAATKFAIRVNVLNKLGELTSEAGDETEARKRDEKEKGVGSLNRGKDSRPLFVPRIQQGPVPPLPGPGSTAARSPAAGRGRAPRRHSDRPATLRTQSRAEDSNTASAQGKALKPSPRPRTAFPQCGDRHGSGAPTGAICGGRVVSTGLISPVLRSQASTPAGYPSAR